MGTLQTSPGPAPCGVATSLRCSARRRSPGGLRPATQAPGGAQDPPAAAAAPAPHPRGEPSAHPTPRKAALIDRADHAPWGPFSGDSRPPQHRRGSVGCRGPATSPAALEGPWGREGSCGRPSLRPGLGRSRAKQEPEASCGRVEKRVGGCGAPGKERSPGCLILPVLCQVHFGVLYLI